MPNVTKLESVKVTDKDKIYHSYLIFEDNEKDFWCIMYMNNYIVSVRKNHSPIEDLKYPDNIREALKKFMSDNPYNK